MVTAAATQRNTVRCELEKAVSRVLHERMVAERDQPPFHRVTMDGVALKFDSCNDKKEFTIASTQLAGDAPHTLTSESHCIEVMTGAHLPLGCDCVVPLEVYKKSDDLILLNDDYQPGHWRNIHLRGSDRKAGEVLLEPGLKIGAPEMAIIASTGSATVAVADPIRTAIVSTGNELIDVGQPIEEYQIRRSNDRAIAATLEKRGHGPVTRAHLKDDAATLEQELGVLLETHDFLIVSGGVSKGVKDLVPDVLRALGVEKKFHGVTQRPGKPLWFGTNSAGKVVFGLPGNPVSSLVCFIRYALPAMDRALGLQKQAQEQAILTEAVNFQPELTWFLPVTLQDQDGKLTAIPRITNTSGDFVSLAGTQGFVELDKSMDEFPVGHIAKLFRW